MLMLKRWMEMSKKELEMIDNICYNHKHNSISNCIEQLKFIRLHSV